MEKEQTIQKTDRQLQDGLAGSYLIGKKHDATKRVGIFYAPSGGNVHKVARLIKQKMAAWEPDMFLIPDTEPSKMLDYHNLVFVSSTLGRSTWEMERNDPWAAYVPAIRKLRLDGRRVALVGLGDHVSYSDNFVDGIAMLGYVVEGLGAQLIGATGTEDYVFNGSQALRDGKFIGLPLDEDYESEKTEERINRWLVGLQAELAG